MSFIKEGHLYTHDQTGHKWYSIWNSMIGRCYRPSQKSFPTYGGRGVSVCDEWRESPLAFIGWLEANEYRKGLQLDRIDNDGDYSPENCRVVTAKENSNNRSNNVRHELNGEMLTVAQISDASGRDYHTLYARLSRGLCAFDAAFGKIRKSPDYRSAT